MRFTGVETGADFERFIIGGLREAGLVVHDTPASGDYGADLVFEYRGIRFAGQCKYYSNRVGIQAVQEIIAALGYYEADYGVVFTNAAFTQQANNLAQANGVLLLDGEALMEFSYDARGIPLFDAFLKGCNTVGNHQTETEWVMNDLVARYGFSAQKIIKDCISRGLPYYKVGREYRFVPQQVEQWEIAQRTIPVGKTGVEELPAFREFRLRLIHAYQDAKKSGDREKAQGLKRVMRRNGIRCDNEWLAFLAAVGVVLAFAVFLIWVGRFK